MKGLFVKTSSGSLILRDYLAVKSYQRAGTQAERESAGKTGALNQALEPVKHWPELRPECWHPGNSAGRQRASVPDTAVVQAGERIRFAPNHLQTVCPVVVLRRA